MTTIRTDETVKDRESYIGGSDAAAILGLSPWRTAYDVYLEKKGEGTQFEESEAMSWGNILEEPVAREFSKRTGKKVHKVNALLRRKEMPWMGAHLDRRVVGENAILEVKTSGRRDGWGESGTDDLPDQYLCQVLHYLAVTGAEVAYVAALLCGQELRIYTVPRRDDLIEAIEAKEMEFWSCHVLPDEPPDVSNAADAARAWRAERGKIEVASEEVIQDLKTLRVVREQIDEMKAEKERLELGIKTFMETADTLVDVDGAPLVTWKESVSRRLDTKAFKAEHADLYEFFSDESVSRRFLLKKQRGE